MNENGKQVKVFEPTKNLMLQEYPELATISEFRSLSEFDLRFVWYYANPTSPLAYIDISNGTDDTTKLLKATDAAAQGLDDVDKKKIKKFVAGYFTEDVKVAIKRMMLFNPNVRMRAKFNVDQIFRNIERLTHISEDQYLIMEQSDRKAYVDLGTKVVSSMEMMVAIMERGFGIKEEVKEKPSEEVEEHTDNIIQTLDQS